MSLYSRGANFERAVKELFEGMGWPLVIRSAGSHGVADLVALRRGSRTQLISCRIHGKLGPLERESLCEAAKAAGAIPMMAHRPARGRIVISEVKG